MNRYEFISRLRSALENELNSSVVSEHVNYYNEYINSEIHRGRSEADVIAELGDPWAIAKNIISSQETSSNTYDDYSYVSPDRDSDNRQNDGGNVHVFGIDTWWKKVLLILGIIGIILLVVSIISGLISLIAPFLLPILIIYFVLKIFKKR